MTPEDHKKEDTRLQKLLKQKDQLNARIKKEESKLRTKERKKETKRKIIIGAIVQKHCQVNPDTPYAKETQSLLNKYVTRSEERKLLNLPPLENEVEETSKTNNDSHVDFRETFKTA